MFKSENKTKKNVKTNLLICGELSYTPLGRHTLAFINTLKDIDNLEIYLNVILSPDIRHLYDKLIRCGACKPFKNSNTKKFDFSFYTHLIPIHNSTCLYCDLGFEEKKSIINAYYCVFDGTIPPLHWIEFINSRFDLCITPSKFTAKTLIKYGLKVCCFHLHCPIINNNYLQHTPKLDHNKKFRFGFIGTIDFKKDLPLVINSFVNEFSNYENIELYIHITGTPDVIMKDEIHSSLEMAKSKNANIVVTNGHLPQEKIEEIFVTFDAYVFPQKITGYFTTLAEALSIGIPVITSYIPPLIEISDYIDSENNIFWLTSKKLTPAFANFSNYMLLGACFECSRTELQNKMRELYSNRVHLFNRNLIVQRKEAAKSLSADNLKDQWQALIKPDKFEVSDGGHGVFVNSLCISSQLHMKYQKIYPNNEISTINKMPPLAVADNKKSYWYEDLPEYHVIEEFSKYHQLLVCSLMNNHRMYIAPEYSKQRNLLFHLNKTLSIAYEIITSEIELKKSIKTIISKIKNII